MLEATCHVEYFSPLREKEVPSYDLLYIGGGYPELHKERLAQNREMIESIREMAEAGGFIYAEAGGFMYLVDSTASYPVCGILPGEAVMTDRLQRFGYATVLLNRDCLLGKKGDKLAGNEFHRSLANIEREGLFSVTKCMSRQRWQCGYEYKNVLAGYPQINFLGNMKALTHLLDTVERGL